MKSMSMRAADARSSGHFVANEGNNKTLTFAIALNNCPFVSDSGVACLLLVSVKP